jgi:hypothetical protein
MLLPFVGEPRPQTQYQGIVGEIFSGPLAMASAGSARHHALVEVVRRACKQAAMDADRRDKLASVPKV